MSVVEYIAHRITTRDLGLTIRDALIDAEIQAYDNEGEKIAISAEQVLSVDFNDPCNLLVETPSGARFTIKIERIRSRARATIQKELTVTPTNPEYGPRNV